MDKFYQELIEGIIKDKLSIEDSLKFRRKLARKYHPRVFPSITQILTHASEKQLPKLRHLVSKPSRVVSGVAVVAVMTKPMKREDRTTLWDLCVGPNSATSKQCLI